LKKTGFRDGALLLFVLIIYALLFGIKQPDYFRYLEPWLQDIKTAGSYKGLAESASNYTGGYITCLYASYLLLSSFGDLVVIKVTALVGVLGCAIASTGIIRRLGADLSLPSIFALFLLIPTVVINGVAWAQADSFYTAFLVLCFYFSWRQNMLWTVLCFGLALSFKLQAIFFAPFLIGFWWGRWRIIGIFIVLFPLTYLFVNLIYMAAGRPVFDIIMIYFGQFGEFSLLSMNAPNLWLLLIHALPLEAVNYIYMPAVILGLMIGVIASGWLALKVYQTRSGDAAHLLYYATLILFLIPFILPKMHERFFFPADIFLFMLVMIRPRFLPAFILTQAASILSYSLHHDLLGLDPVLWYGLRILLGILCMGAGIFWCLKEGRMMLSTELAVKR